MNIEIKKMRKTLILFLVIGFFSVCICQNQDNEIMNLNTFWKQPTEEFTEKTRGRTENELLIREKQIGFKLPNTYRELMKIQNGGFIRRSAFEYNGSLQPLIYNGGMIDHIYPEPFGYENMFDVLSEWMDEDEIDEVSDTEFNFLNRLIIISHMDGHSFMCFDYGWKEKEVKAEPEICFFNDDFKEYLRLENFDTFVNGLYYYGYESYKYYFGFHGIASIETIKNDLESKLNFKFEKKYTDEPGKLDAYRWHANFAKWYQGRLEIEDDLELSLHLSENKFKSGNFLFQEKKETKVILTIVFTRDKTKILFDGSSKYLKIINKLLSKSSFYNSIEELLIPLNKKKNTGK